MIRGSGASERTWTYRYHDSGDSRGALAEVDARDRLTRYGTLTYDWDASGDLTRKTDTATGDITRYDYDASGHLQDVELPDGRTIDYRVGPTDHLSSVRLVVNASTGNVVQRMKYDAFGNVLQDTNPGLQPFGYAGGL